MTGNYIETLPEVLQPYYPGSVQEAHEAYQVLSPDVVDAYRYSYRRVPPAQGRSAFALLEPILDHTEYDPSSTEAILTPEPLAVGINKRTIGRYSLAADAHDGGIKNLVIQSPTLFGRSCILDRSERKKVANGDPQPFVDQYCRAVEYSGINRVRISAYSQPGFTAAFLAHELERKGVADVESILFAEYPNGEERSPFKLFQDNSKCTPADITRAILGGQIPADIKAGNARGGIWTKTKQLGGFGLFFCGIPKASNIALIRGMGKDTFDYALDEYLGSGPAKPTNATIVLARAGNSAMLKESVFEQTERELEFLPFDADFVTVPGFGHELDDHIVVKACLEKLVAVRHAQRQAANLSR